MMITPTSVSDYIWVTCIFFVALILRYFLVAGIFHLYFNIMKKHQYQPHKLSRVSAGQQQFRREIFWSVLSSIIFALTGTLTFLLWYKGYTAIYLEPDAYPYWYLPVSLVIVMLLHETYYYWIHRWMHQPHIFRLVHRAHHESIAPTPWTAFSFHPLESILEALILPILLIVIPMHVSVLSIYLLIMTISSVVNHLDIEIYPQAFRESLVGKLLIGATHHHFHHQEFSTNYGLYFTFWDQWMGTESVKMNKKS